VIRRFEILKDANHDYTWNHTIRAELPRLTSLSARCAAHGAQVVVRTLQFMINILRVILINSGSAGILGWLLLQSTCLGGSRQGLN
jgi:hypothetical protein